MQYAGRFSKLNLHFETVPSDSSKWQKLKSKLYNSILVSENHPRTMEYFRTEVAVLKEKKRHYEQFRYTIHPLSKFNQFYEAWCFFFYGILMYFKTFDFGFVRISYDAPFKMFSEFLTVSAILDIISLINIIFQFSIGYTDKSTKYIELSKSRITLRYLCNGHFFCDLLSSIPRVITWKSNAAVFLITLSLGLLKLRRLTTFISLIKPTALLFGIRSSTKTFLFGFIFIISLATHIVTCFHFGMPRYREVLVKYYQEESLETSFVTTYITNLPVVKRYMLTFFQSAQYTFQIELPYFKTLWIAEEVLLSIINYIAGKTLTAVIWIILLYKFVTKMTLRTKFEEIITELNEYVRAKQMPLDVKERLLSYYNYKYQRVFFNEVFIRSILSENLKREIDFFLYKSLIRQVSIFSYIDTKTVKTVITQLVLQIYLPGDIIIQSGTYGDSMFFIESGTVAVISPSGKEICHLHDGAYFGEISVVIKDQIRTANIVAIEETRIYKLGKVQFDRCLRKIKVVYDILVDSATKRIEETHAIEKKYKKLFDVQNVPGAQRLLSISKGSNHHTSFSQSS